jgi:GAF domain-containing protein
MIKPAKPINEEQRLQALRDLLILDTKPEERFDRITEFASFEFEVPIVLISLVDDNRQWFKSFTGINTCETSRDVSFCAHAILQDEIMIVEDATKDERFFDNPLVTGDPHVCFYAGAALTLKTGEKIGTLCLIDQKPKQLSQTELSIFSSLRNMVIAELMITKNRQTPPELTHIT